MNCEYTFCDYYNKTMVDNCSKGEEPMVDQCNIYKASLIVVEGKTFSCPICDGNAEKLSIFHVKVECPTCKGKKVVFDTSPKITEHLDEIYKDCPDCAGGHIYRDPTVEDLVFLINRDYVLNLLKNYRTYDNGILEVK